jgi:hypothetical protein
MRRSDRWSFIVLGIGVAAVLGGVQLAGMLDDTPDLPGAESEFCPDSPGEEARSDTVYRDTAEAYRGNGPHPVALNVGQADVEQMDLPDGWMPGKNDTSPRPQLVACVYPDAATTPHKVRECRYTHNLNAQATSKYAVRVSLMKAAYVFRLYEAKTAKPVGRFQVPGEDACPATYTTNQGEAIPQGPDPAKLRTSLRPYVERAA